MKVPCLPAGRDSLWERNFLEKVTGHLKIAYNISMDPGEPIPGKSPLVNELINPRTISKKLDVEGRNKTALSILEARADARTTRKQISEKEQKLEDISELTGASYGEEYQKNRELTKRMESLAVKLKNMIRVGDSRSRSLQKEISDLKVGRDPLYSQSLIIENELKSLKEKQPNIPEPKQILDAYYEKMATRPLTNEQKRELLKPEVLASLSTEEYIALWRRLNPYFLSHVTRQGFRDHNAMVYHSRGLQEFHDGFVNTLKDEKLLRPPLALHGLKNRDEFSVRKWLDGWILKADDRQQAKERFQNLLHFTFASAPKYPDETAVHFAAQIVANDYYGGENGNEVFYLYPSDVLVSQHPFAFNRGKDDLTKPQSERKWNDVFVWPEGIENLGIAIDAGIVFLPENTPVDPETGSKYASEVKLIDGQEKRIMIEDTALVSSFVEWGQKLTDKSPLKKLFLTYTNEARYDARRGLEKECFTAFVHEFEGMGFKIDASAALAHEVIETMFWKDSLDTEILQKIVRDSAANWKRAEKTVPAKEYWENFFTENPELHPKHIEYYNGDPTNAVLTFQQKNNIGRADTSGTDGQLLGFDDHYVLDPRSDSRANPGYDDLVSKANKIIDDFYGSNT